MEFYATCPASFEAALGNELRCLGCARVRPLKGRVSFEGDAAAGMRVCLWTRLASRVYAVLGRVDAADADALYAGVSNMAWEEILRPEASIAVHASGTNAALANTHFTALRVKDAICDRLARARGARPQVDTAHPDARIAVSMRSERATVSFDLAGDPLFKRFPPRTMTHLAHPHAHVLRPDYAALVLAQAGWLAAGAGAAEGAARAGGSSTARTLVDVGCAGGGVALEAAQLLRDRAPGLARTTWGFRAWTAADEGAWQELVADARARAEAGAATRALIVATDVDPAARADAQALIAAAGLEDAVAFIEPDADALHRALRQHGGRARADEAGGLIVLDALDTPLGRMPNLLALVAAARGDERGRAFPLVALAGDELVGLVADTAPRAQLTVRADDEAALLITYPPAGTGETAQRATQSAAHEPDRSAAHAPGRPQPYATCIDLGDGKPLPLLIPESEQFARRLRKVARQRRKWAQHEGVGCYRVYDADLPDYAVAIDLYTGAAATPGRWLVIAEYAAPKSVDPTLARARLLDALAIAPRILDVDPACVHARTRARARGGSQYGKRASGGAGNASRTGTPARRLPRITEGGLTFEVNFDDYLDTGIFLDHRITRGIVRERARHARTFLNLFAYTGTATCYAADAGVDETVTVDLSNTYLDWAERNMRLNGFSGPRHHYVRADVLSWIAEQRHGRNRWDLIFCDPPTFSNSSKMGKRSFDVQRDHVDLLVGISRLLTQEGEAIFSCNLRTFKPDVPALARAGVVLEDISAQTIPEDFARNPRIHRCYLLWRTSPDEAQRRMRA